MGSSLLMAFEYMSYLILILIEFIINIEYGPSRVYENRIDTLLQETFHNYLRTGQLHDIIPFDNTNSPVILKIPT